MLPESPERGFSLIELLVVAAIVAILSAIAVPSYMRARAQAEETRVYADLKEMARTQELFYMNPVPVEPSDLSDTGKRYARLHELNTLARSQFGTARGTYYLLKGPAMYSMVPLWPSNESLHHRGTRDRRLRLHLRARRVRRGREGAVSLRR
jgi:prepilin-type N-terminal cleavage/methylation domain-containing protein